jgi:hypothetical protein
LEKAGILHSAQEPALARVSMSRSSITSPQVSRLLQLRPWIRPSHNMVSRPLVKCRILNAFMYTRTARMNGHSPERWRWT